MNVSFISCRSAALCCCWCKQIVVSGSV
uniref:Uncharacterized protein n=1 Tax=Anguilla anguilla TaxID=7936 RepID=A0A0E9Q547_ANGAN